MACPWFWPSGTARCDCNGFWRSKMIVQSLVEKYPPLVSLVCTMTLPTAKPQAPQRPHCPHCNEHNRHSPNHNFKNSPNSSGDFYATGCPTWWIVRRSLSRRRGRLRRTTSGLRPTGVLPLKGSSAVIRGGRPPQAGTGNSCCIK